MSYTRSSAFAGERFVDLAHARRHAERWCRDVAGQRIRDACGAKPSSEVLQPNTAAVCARIACASS